MPGKTIVYQSPSLILKISVSLSIIAVGLYLLPTIRLINLTAASAAIVSWSGFGFDELRYGDSWVRRLMGVLVLVAMIVLMTALFIHE